MSALPGGAVTFTRGVKVDGIVHTCPTPFRRGDGGVDRACYGKTTCDMPYEARVIYDDENAPTRWLGYIKESVVTCIACVGTR